MASGSRVEHSTRDLHTNCAFHRGFFWGWVPCHRLPSIEEGRAASKSPHKTFSYFLSISQQEVSADIIPKFSCLKLLPKNRRTNRQKQLDASFSDVFSLPVHFEFFVIFSYC